MPIQPPSNTPQQSRARIKPAPQAPIRDLPAMDSKQLQQWMRARIKPAPQAPRES